MALELYEYPSSGAPTATFAPTLNADPDGSREAIDDGVLSEQSAGKRVYFYREAIRVRDYTRAYRKMPLADRDAVIAFLTAVGGRPFKFTDYNGGTHICSFTEWVTEYRWNEGDRFDFDLKFREEL